MKKEPTGLAGQVGNNLLRALRAEDWEILKPMLEEWSPKTGTVLHEPGDAVHFAYFPRATSLISYFVVLSDGRAVETALIGREGAAGGIVSQGRLPAFTRAEVQVGGPFYRIELTSLQDAKNRSPTLRHLFARYADCLMAQIFQSVACNAVHSLEQRTAKWLLAAHERTGSGDLVLTQEQLSAMLGVGRSYLSRVILSLKRRAVLETGRGRITVRDSNGLRLLACECNGAVARHFKDVLQGVYPSELSR